MLRTTSIALLLAGLALACGPPGLVPTATPTAEPDPTRTPAPEMTPTLSPTPPPALPPTPTVPADPLASQRAALLESHQDDVSVLQGQTQYVIDASVEFDAVQQQATITGIARIRYLHSGPDPIETLPLMLWPNDEQYRGGLEVGLALIDGRRLQGAPLLDGLAVEFALPTGLTAGEAVDLTVPFTATAEGPIGGSTPHRYGITEAVLFAPTFYPLVPRREGGEWEVQDAPPGGDTTNSDVAAYWVRLDVPSDLRLVASGAEVAREEGAGRTSVSFVAGPVRDFAFALGPFEHDVRTVDGTAVHGWFLPGHAGDADLMLDAATDQLQILSERVGPYPYTELDLVDVPGAFGGIEYPGLVTIGTLGTSWLIEPVVHEVAHQWFYGLIGGDQVDEPWMDEAFATYSMALYLEFAEGRGQATGYLSDLREIVRNHPQSERPIGLGLGAYPGGDYSTFVYLKGALFYQALRQRLGDDVFFEFLQRLYREYRYGFATAEDFQATAEATCDCELDPLFDEWVFAGGEFEGR